MANEFDLITNYLYMYHTDTFVVLPTYPESIQDSLSSTFQSTPILARSARSEEHTSELQSP